MIPRAALCLYTTCDRLSSRDPQSSRSTLQLLDCSSGGSFSISESLSLSHSFRSCYPTLVNDSTMATLRQFTEGFYSSGHQKCPRLQLECLFGNLLEDLERQVTVKLFDANRTLTSPNAEHRRTIDLDHIHIPSL